MICDATRQLGTFLIEFEQDPDGEWNRLGLVPLREALHTNRWKQPDLEKTAGSFLRQKYQTGDPVRQYTAFRIWEGYLVARGAQRPVDAGFAPTEAERRYRNRSTACGRFFLAKSQRYELCSEKCRKAQALQNKRDFDKRARENNYDLLYKNECQNWRNKINKAKKTDGFPVEKLKKWKKHL